MKQADKEYLESIIHNIRYSRADTDEVDFANKRQTCREIIDFIEMTDKEKEQETIRRCIDEVVLEKRAVLKSTKIECQYERLLSIKDVENRLVELLRKSLIN